MDPERVIPTSRKQGRAPAAPGQVGRVLSQDATGKRQRVVEGGDKALNSGGRATITKAVGQRKQPLTVTIYDAETKEQPSRDPMYDSHGKQMVVAVGKLCHLIGIMSPPGTEFESMTWRVTGAVQDYVVTRDRAAVVALPDQVQGRGVQFFWAEPGPQKVTVEAKVGGVVVTGEVRFMVLGPKTTLTGAGPASAHVFGGGEYLGHEGDWFALYEKAGDDTLGKPSRMTAIGTGHAPSWKYGGVQRFWRGGSFALIQLTSFVRITTVLEDGRPHEGSYTTRTAGGDPWSAGNYALDNPKKAGSYLIPGSKTEVPGNKDPVNTTLKDAPGLRLSPDTVAALVDDKFRLYLLYRPLGGIWVPLQRLDWSWMAKAERKDPADVTSPWNDPMMLSNDDGTGTARTDGIPCVGPATWPIWDRVAKPGK